MTITLWYLIAMPAWILVLITAASRLSDMGRDQWHVVDHFHRAGLLGMFCAAGIAIMMPFSEDAGRYIAGTWRGALVAWSLATIWVTKRDSIPWWDNIIGVHRATAEWKDLRWSQRVKAELDVLWNGFTPRRYRKPMAGPQGKLP